MATGYYPPSRGAGKSERGGARILVRRRRELTRVEKLRMAMLCAIGLIAAIVVALLIYGSLKLHEIEQRLPSIANLTDSRSHPVTTIVSSDGVLLATFETHYRRPVSLSQISPRLVDATLATEDARFYRHSGIDLRGIARAIVSNAGSGNLSGQGGSTITQQLARNLYLTNQKSLDRKLEEMMLARRIEEKYSKGDILEAYLNTIYYGNGCYGVEAASRAYFHKPAIDLSLGEAAMLAGLPQRPAAYSPSQHLDAALQRREEVLRRMVATGKISQDEAVRTAAQPVKVYRPHLQAQSDWKAPYFVAHVISSLRDKLGAESLYSGMNVVTTLNWQMQRAAEHQLRAALRSGGGPNTGAIVSLDPRSGAIRALVGGPDFKRDQFDAATQGVRQPGSAFKPIVYVTAFDMNAVNLASEIEDKKLEYAGGRKPWIVHNYDGRYRGNVSVLEALRQSINTIAVQVAEQVGPTAVETYGRQLGITTPLAADLPLALGASGVHPIDLCSAYSAFANHGSRYDPYAVEQVKASADRELYRDNPSARFHAPFLNGTALDQINVALREVATNGTGAAAAVVPDAHGKTGTTSSHRDAWFCGYTGTLSTVVWLAHVERRSTSTGHTTIKYLPMPGATGGQLCAPIWARYMLASTKVQARVDGAHNLLPAVVEQPKTLDLLTQLKTIVPDTGMEQDKRALTSRPAAGEESGVDAFGRALAPTAPAYSDADASSAEAAAREQARLEAEDEAMRRDEEQGYREFEQRKDELP